MGLYLIKRQHSRETDNHAPGGTRNHNPSQASGRRPHTLDREATDRRQVIILEEILTERSALFSNTTTFFSNLDPETGWSERVLSSVSPLPLKCWDSMSDQVTITWSHIHSNLLFMSHINRRYINFYTRKGNMWIFHT
jgi:hypothetical protein